MSIVERVWDRFPVSAVSRFRLALHRSPSSGPLRCYQLISLQLLDGFKLCRGVGEPPSSFLGRRIGGASFDFILIKNNNGMGSKKSIASDSIDVAGCVCALDLDRLTLGCSETRHNPL